MYEFVNASQAFYVAVWRGVGGANPANMEACASQGPLDGRG